MKSSVTSGSSKTDLEEVIDVLLSPLHESVEDDTIFSVTSPAEHHADKFSKIGLLTGMGKKYLAKTDTVSTKDELMMLAAQKNEGIEFGTRFDDFAKPPKDDINSEIPQDKEEKLTEQSSTHLAAKWIDDEQPRSSQTDNKFKKAIQDKINKCDYRKKEELTKNRMPFDSSASKIEVTNISKIFSEKASEERLETDSSIWNDIDSIATWEAAQNLPTNYSKKAAEKNTYEAENKERETLLSKKRKELYSLSYTIASMASKAEGQNKTETSNKRQKYECDTCKLEISEGCKCFMRSLRLKGQVELDDGLDIIIFEILEVRLVYSKTGSMKSVKTRLKKLNRVCETFEKIDRTSKRCYKCNLVIDRLQKKNYCDSERCNCFQIAVRIPFKMWAEAPESSLKELLKPLYEKELEGKTQNRQGNKKDTCIQTYASINIKDR